MPRGIAQGGDGNLWFTVMDGADPRVGKITPAGAITEFSVPAAAPNGITAGPDGNVWFTAPGGSSVGFITPSGSATVFPVPPASCPLGIASGPDGNLWFAEECANKIGRITTGGQLTEFAIPTSNTNPTAITRGPDGSMWFTEQSNGAIGRITMSGQVTEFPICCAAGYGITTGPDGNIWFTLPSTNEIGRLTSWGSFDRFPIPTARSLAHEITAAADGDLWFTEYGTGLVGRITPWGSVNEFSISSQPGAPDGITQGPDGNVWVAEQGSKIARITPLRDHYTPLSPSRILDTRPGSGQPDAGRTLGQGSTVDVQVSGVGGVPSSGVTSVYMNVTATNATASSYLTVYPTAQLRPLASNLNFIAGQTHPNLVHVPVGRDGRVTIYNLAGNTDVVADIEGYTVPDGGAAGLYEPVTPNRLADTRPGSGSQGAGSAVAGGHSLTLQVAGRGGVPTTGAGAAVLNVTATDTTSAAFVTAYPADKAQPTASNLNFVPGETVANRVVVPLSSDGRVTLFNSAGNTDLVVDVNGWFTNGSTADGGATIRPTTPSRIYDSRAGSNLPGAGSPIGAGSVVPVQVAGMGRVPAMASPGHPTAVVLNVTSTNSTADGYFTVYPSDVPRPQASDLNWRRGVTVPNLVVVGVGEDGRVDVFNPFGFTDLVVDVLGYYTN